jgi:hypothetical protein
VGEAIFATLNEAGTTGPAPSNSPNPIFLHSADAIEFGLADDEGELYRIPTE